MIPLLSTSGGVGVGCGWLDPAEEENVNKDFWTSLRCSLINSLKGSFPITTILPFQVNTKPTCSPVTSVNFVTVAKRDSLALP